MDEPIYEVPVTDEGSTESQTGSAGDARGPGYTPSTPVPPSNATYSSAAPTMPPPPGFEAAAPSPMDPAATTDGPLPTPGAGYEFQSAPTAPSAPAGAPRREAPADAAAEESRPGATAPPAAGNAPGAAAGAPPAGYGAPAAGYGQNATGYGAPPTGYGAPGAGSYGQSPGFGAPAPSPAPAFNAPPPPPPDPAAQEPIRRALQLVIDSGGSDLHVGADTPPMIRVDGTLSPVEGAAAWSSEEVSRNVRAIMSPQQQTVFDQQLELDFAFGLSEGFRFRVNVYQQRESVGAAFRLIPTEIKSIEELGLPAAVARFAELPRGLVLVTGPTGSGKSTTLASLIELANQTRADHIMTVEDPIEFLHTNGRSLVNQREVGADTHSFANALKHVLRQDPDIILIGEMRDLETISVALTAAETGHLVFATLHTQSAAQTIDRVIDVFPPHQQDQVRAQLASTLQGVVCQSLVRRAEGRGRVVATEVLTMTPAIANLIREGKTFQVPSAMQAGRAQGMHTLDQHLAELVNSGEVSYGAAAEKAQDLEDFKRRVHRGGDGQPSDYGQQSGYGRPPGAEGVA